MCGDWIFYVLCDLIVCFVIGIECVWDDGVMMCGWGGEFEGEWMCGYCARRRVRAVGDECVVDVWWMCDVM